MSEWSKKRFWKTTEVQPGEGGFVVCLDGRPVRTPAKQPLALPSRALAAMVAAEWQAQGDRVDPETMPATRMANLALDRIEARFDEVVDTIAAYGGSDLLCYRADGPEALVARQSQGWDPLLAWAEARFHAPLAVTNGVMPIDQPPESLRRLRAAVAAQDRFRICALHDLVALSGSLVLGLAAVERFAPPEALWALSRIDEDWQREQWGDDDEALAVTARREAGFLHAAAFLTALDGD